MIAIDSGTNNNNDVENDSVSTFRNAIASDKMKHMENEFKYLKCGNNAQNLFKM